MALDHQVVMQLTWSLTVFFHLTSPGYLPFLNAGMKGFTDLLNEIPFTFVIKLSLYAEELPN